MSTKVAQNYKCELCDYTTSIKGNYEIHFNTLKHKINQSATTSSEKVAQNYNCIECYYTTSQKYNWEKHIKTEKHKINTLLQNNKKVAENYKCEICENVYKDRSGLWRHAKTCKPINEDKQEYAKSESDILKITSMFLESMKQNQDFQKEVIGIIKDGSMSNSHNTTNTNSNNKQKFNLNFFLNETCKDAMNLSEFVDSLKITLKDLENVGRLGYTEGISRIFTKGLKELEVTKRPIHCSDLKRETVYVKNENKWEKDDNQLKKAIKQITNKNIKLIPKWKEENPGHQQYHNKRNDDYLKIMYESMGPTDELEESQTYSKIITNLAKETTISKE